MERVVLVDEGLRGDLVVARAGKEMMLLEGICRVLPSGGSMSYNRERLWLLL